MTRQVVINADDFGWTDGHNLAVEKAHRCGILTRASLLCNGPAFNQAVEIARRTPTMGVGVHLTLNEGLPVLSAKRVPHLTNQEGFFFDGLQALISRWASGRLNDQECYAEWNAQADRALETGLQINHLDSHKHVHLLPPLLEAAIKIAGEKSIPYLRLPIEKFSMVAGKRGAAGIVFWMLAQRARVIISSAGLSFADHFVGVGSSGSMAAGDLLTAIENAHEGITEIMVHPAVLTPAVQKLKERYSWAAKYRFEQELQALCDVKHLVEHKIPDRELPQFIN